jgi:hypothetical protein
MTRDAICYRPPVRAVMLVRVVVMAPPDAGVS